jgi:hypothetical protein
MVNEKHTQDPGSRYYPSDARPGPFSLILCAIGVLRHFHNLREIDFLRTSRPVRETLGRGFQFTVASVGGTYRRCGSALPRPIESLLEMTCVGTVRATQNS